MLTFIALAQAKHQNLQREFAELRRLAAARAVDRTPLELSASKRRARTVSSLKGDGPSSSPLRPC